MREDTPAASVALMGFRGAPVDQHAGSERVSTTLDTFISLLTPRSDWAYTSSAASIEKAGGFVDKPDLTDLLAQLVREEFGYVLREKPEEPNLHPRIVAILDAVLNRLRTARIAR